MTPQQPGYGYPGPQPPPQQSGGGGITKLLWAGVALFAVALLAGIGLAVSPWRPGGQDVASMSYISANDPGPAPFTDSVASVNQSAIVPVSRESMSGSVTGGSAGLYGGSGSEAVCDAEGLIRNLASMPAQRSAFAGALGLSDGMVDPYIRSLRPVVLMHDTWVTNHGYQNGRAVPFQSTLQAGTAVLIDAYGVPRVQCGCGNPLAPRWSGYVVPWYGSPWPGYDHTRVVNIYAPTYHNETINVTNIYREGDVYNVTFENIVEPDRPELRTTPRDMGVRPDTDQLDEAGVNPAPEEEWDGDGEATRPAEDDSDEEARSGGGTGTGGADEDEDEGAAAAAAPADRASEARESGSDEADAAATGDDDVSSVTIQLPRNSSSTFDKDTSTFEEGTVTFSVRGRDGDGDTSSGKCDFKVVILDSNGREVKKEEKKGVSCSREFSFSGMKAGSYTARVTANAKGERETVTDSVSFKVVKDLDRSSSSTTSSSSSRTSTTTRSSDTATRTTTQTPQSTVEPAPQTSTYSPPANDAPASTPASGGDSGGTSGGASGGASGDASGNSAQSDGDTY